MIRWFRFAVFVGALWLTTPWWGRRDFMILQFQRRAIMVVIGTVLLGLAISPTKAFANATGGRLGGIVWPIQPTQVAHYSAVLVGMTVVLWLAGSHRSRRWTAVDRRWASAVLILTHTRTALVAMLAGILVGGLSLFLSRKRVRRACVVDDRGGWDRRTQFCPARDGMVRAGSELSGADPAHGSHQCLVRGLGTASDRGEHPPRVRDVKRWIQRNVNRFQLVVDLSGSRSRR